MGHSRFEIKGNRFGRLVALGVWKYNTTPKGKKIIMEKCICDCGNEKRISRSNLLNGLSTSCGCRWGEYTKGKPSINRSHGMASTRIYKIYHGIVRRCNNINVKNYGGRGIKCLWKSFEDFYKDMGEDYESHVEKYGESNTTIDRIDVNGDYCKENCRWATYKQQNNNRTNSMKIDYNGKKYESVKDVCNSLGLNYGRITYRINHGWDIKDAIEIKKRGIYGNNLISNKQ